MTRLLVFQKEVRGLNKFSDRGSCRWLPCVGRWRCASIASIGRPQTLMVCREPHEDALYVLGSLQRGRLISSHALGGCDLATALQMHGRSHAAYIQRTRTHRGLPLRCLVCASACLSTGATERGGSVRSPLVPVAARVCLRILPTELEVEKAQLKR